MLKDGITLRSTEKRKILNFITLNSFGITKSMCEISIISSWTLWTIGSIVVSTSSLSPSCKSYSTMGGWLIAHSTNSTFSSYAPSNIILSWETISSPCCSSILSWCFSTTKISSSMLSPMGAVIISLRSIYHPWFPNWISLSFHLLQFINQVLNIFRELFR